MLKKENKYLQVSPSFVKSRFQFPFNTQV